MDGGLAATDTVDATMCANDLDTTCGITTLPTSVSTGTTLYFKQTSGGTHFKCTVTLGSNLVSAAHTPTPAPVSAPILDLNQPAVIYSEEINVTK
jgi:hypothetical protein